MEGNRRSIHPQRPEERLVDAAGDFQVLVVLILADGCTGAGADIAIDLAVIVALVLEGMLDVHGQGVPRIRDARTAVGGSRVTAVGNAHGRAVVTAVKGDASEERDRWEPWTVEMTARPAVIMSMSTVVVTEAGGGNGKAQHGEQGSEVFHGVDVLTDGGISVHLQNILHILQMLQARAVHRTKKGNQI